MLETYLKPIFAFAAKRTDNAAEAEDLAQEIMCQAVSSLSKKNLIANYNAYIWSIAHNTYKRWVIAKRADRRYLELHDTFGNVMKFVDSPEDSVVESEFLKSLRRELTLLTGYYRRAIVHHYFDGMSCDQIAKAMNVSIEMSKYYLSAGRKKIREGIEMAREYGEKSFNPSVFKLYKSGWSTINPWSLFTRKLPGNIVLACYEKPIDIHGLSMETGVPTVFLEDELRLLLDAGLVAKVSKDRYQTAFFVADAKLIEQVEVISHATVSRCVMELEAAFQLVLPIMKSLGLFKFVVSEERYKWLFMQYQNIFDIPFSSNYPKILSDGSENFIWGEEADCPAWSGGRTHYEGHDHVICAIDINRLGFRHQDYLRNKGSVLVDLAKGMAEEARIEEYANLIRDGYATRVGDVIHLNMPVVTVESDNALRMEIDRATQSIRESVDIHSLLDELEKAITPRMTGIVQGVPREYAALILSVHMESYLLEEMHRRGHLPLPEAGDRSPMTSFLILK